MINHQKLDAQEDAAQGYVPETDGLVAGHDMASSIRAAYRALPLPKPDQVQRSQIWYNSLPPEGKAEVMRVSRARTIELLARYWVWLQKPAPVGEQKSVAVESCLANRPDLTTSQSIENPVPKDSSGIMSEVDNSDFWKAGGEVSAEDKYAALGISPELLRPDAAITADLNKKTMAQLEANMDQVERQVAWDARVDKWLARWAAIVAWIKALFVPVNDPTQIRDVTESGPMPPIVIVILMFMVTYILWRIFV